MVTERDKKILDHINKYGFVTINQAIDMFFNNLSFAYDIARRRLNKLADCGFVNKGKISVSNQNIYFINSKPSYQYILYMDFICKLIGRDCHIQELKFNTKIDNIPINIYVGFSKGEKDYLYAIDCEYFRKSKCMKKFIPLTDRENEAGIPLSIAVICDKNMRINNANCCKYKLINLELNNIAVLF